MPIHRCWDVFTQQERRILHSRVVADDPTRSTGSASITFANVLEAMIDYHLWLHLILNLVSLSPKGGLQLYGLSVIKNFGFFKINANLLNAVSSVLTIIFSYLISLGSDRTHLRGFWCIIAFMYSIAFAGALFGLPLDTTKWTRYAIFTLLGAGNALAQGLNDAWVNINATTPSKRSLALAFVVIGSNLGGIAGQQHFRSDDAPRYTRAFLAILLLYASSVVITLLLIWIYWWGNRKATKLRRDDPGPVRKFEL